MDSDRYKWIALSNTTLGVLLATLDASIILIAMPNIFRGIKLDPLVPGNSFYQLWMTLGYLVVTSVLIVSLGPSTTTRTPTRQRNHAARLGS
jgi:hypothetical protein